MPRSRTSRPVQPSLEESSGRNRHLLALSILFLLPVLLFYSTILGDRQFMGHDTIQWRAGAESIFEYREAHDGEEPLWATNMFGGMPAYTVHVSKSVPHLDNMVFDQLRMIWPAVPYWVLLGGLYFLFTLMGFRPLVSLLGAIFIGFTTYFPIIIEAGHNIKFIAYSYLPWMLAGYWLLTRTSARTWGLALFAIATTLEFRAGHPQVTYYFVYLFAALFLYDSWQYYRQKDHRTWAMVTGLLTLGVALAVLGSAEQYWRLLEYSPHSIRGGSAISDTASGAGLSLEYAFTWSQGITETLTLMIPDLFGGSSSMAYWGEKPGTSGPHYLGAVAVLLFLIGLLRSQRQIRYLFAGTGLLAITFSWGYHFPLNELWFHLLPGFDKFRTPEMWLTLTIFCFSIVALFGLEHILQWAGEKRADLKPLLLPAGLALGTGLLILLGGSQMFSFENDREQTQIAQQIANQNDLSPDNTQVQRQTRRIIESRFKPERRELMRSDTLRYLFFAGLGLLLIVLFLNQKIGALWLLSGLILISTVDLLTTGKRYLNEENLANRNQELTQVIEAQQTPADRFLQKQTRTDNGYQWRVLPIDRNPFNNAIPSYFYPTLGGYSGAKLSLVQDVIDNGLFTGPAGINKPLLDMLNVKYLTSRRELPLPGFREVYQEQGHYVYENLSVLPKAWFVDRVEPIRDLRGAFAAILPASEFDPSTTAIVETTRDPEIRPDPDATVQVRSYTARRIELELERSTPGFLVLSEIYYPPGWQARLNGEDIPILKTNYLLRGFEIPPGSHQLTLEFHPRSHIAGSKISWAANLAQWGLLLILLAGRYRPSRTGEPHES